MDGKFVKWVDAKIHVLTHTLHYGGGVFEGIRCYSTDKGPAIFRGKDHVRRMFNSAKLIGMKIPFSFNEIFNAMKETIRKNKISECYIRPIAFYGYGKMGLSPIGAPVNVAIAVWPWGPYLGAEAKEKGVKCKISKWRRIDPRTLPTNAKVCGYYINSILAHCEAISAGCQEAILLSTNSYVAEGPGENIFIVKRGELITPPIATGILPGITRDSVIRIARDEGFSVEIKDISKEQLLRADEAFFTGTAAEICPIREIDGKVIGTGGRGPITERLQKIYAEVVRGKIPKYLRWLDFV